MPRSDAGDGLSGRVVLVTGAAGGIGHAVSLAFAREGAGLALLDVQAPEIVRQEATALGCRTLAVGADVSDRTRVHAAVARTTDVLGRLDILVNVAGIVSKLGNGRGTQRAGERTRGWRRGFKYLVLDDCCASPNPAWYES